MSTGIFLGLGTNLGEREQNLEEAQRMIGLKIVSASSVYETEPVDFLEQPWFLNRVIQVEEGLTARELLHRCQEVERRMGRNRDIPKGPRIIDIDILFYDDLILNEPDLVIPHPAIPRRRFVLEPMTEIAPNFVHPVLVQDMNELLQRCPDSSVVRKK